LHGERSIYMPHLTGGQAVVAALRAHGVDTIFGIPGVHTLPLYDAMLDEPGLRHVLARHEQGAGFMADGYARISGKEGVVSVITGPGVTNVATPVADAYADAVPLLVIASGLPRASRGRRRGELHETKNQFGVMDALAGWTRAVEYVEEIPDAIRDVFRAMRMGRPHGAYIEIPLDLLEMGAQFTITAPAPLAPPLPSGKIPVIAKYLREAQRPLIMAGNGVTAAGANAQLLQLAELLGAPVMLDRKSRDTLPTRHPLVITTSGYPLTPAMYEMISTSDVVLVIDSRSGASTPGQSKLRLPDTVLQIDREPSEIGRLFPVTLGMVADARFALDGLLAALQDAPRDRPSRYEEVAHVKGSLVEHVRQRYGGNMAFLDAVREAVPEDGVIVADMTKLGYASSEYLPLYEARTYIHPSELCSIGCGLPIALGAKVAAPDKPVVTLCGDGGFLLNVGELATAVQEQIDVVTVVFNDATYTAVKQQQARRYHRRYIATDLHAPDYVTIAQAFSINGLRVSTPHDLSEALAQAIQRGGSTLIEVTLPPVEW
jgi:thiamine pyrophosphate-dependent acetolactate synthase large subunit-like protein